MRKKGFTLAEVLITLGIIGVVAAMTIPTLISNYQKKVTINRLKLSYSTLMQVFKMAEVEHGPISTWGMTRNAGLGTTTQAIKDFIVTYMLPYMSGYSYNEKKTMADFGYKEGIKYPDGSICKNAETSLTPIRLRNGMFIITSLTSFRDSDNVSHYFSLTFYVDINGPAGENVVGKDVFVLQQLFDNVPVYFAGELNWNFYFDTNTFEYLEPLTRQELFDMCALGDESAKYCGALIKIDGWEIKDDYPWIK